MDLYLIRHAWAVERGDWHGSSDDLRPLTPLGRERFARVAAVLAERGLRPEWIAVSPLARCVETAQLLAAAAPEGTKIVELDALRPGSDLEGLLAWTARQARSHERIAWIGHSPDLDRMTAALIGSPDAMIRFAKGSAAAVRFEGLPALGGGELQWLVTAKMLGL